MNYVATPDSTAGDWRGRATITVPEAASILGIGRSAAYDAVGRELPTIRIGRRVLVPTHALRRMLGEIPENESSPARKPGLTKLADGASHSEEYSG